MRVKGGYSPLEKDSDGFSVQGEWESRYVLMELQMQKSQRQQNHKNSSLHNGKYRIVFEICFGFAENDLNLNEA